MAKTRKTRQRLIVVLAFEDVQLLDVTGPVQVFASANEMVCGTRGAPSHGAPYRIVVVSRRGGAIRSSSGLPLVTETDRHVQSAAGPSIR